MSNPFKKKLTAVCIAVVLGADLETIIGEAPFDGTIESVEWIPTTGGLTGAATNNRTLSVINKGQAGAGTVVPASLNFGAGVSATAFDKKALTNSATAADLEVVKGDVLSFKSLHVGTGIADPGGQAIVTIVRS